MARLKQLNWRRRGILLVAIVLIFLSWWQILRVRTSLEIRTLEEAGLPMTLIAPAGAQNQPGVLIAHGFGGSQQIMLGYAYTLANAGYTTLLWDFAGHAANPAPLNRDAAVLQDNLDTAYATLINQPEVDPGRVGLLGHSMGSGAVMNAALRDGDRYSGTVAVSPTDAAVTPTLPRNIQFQAGQYEQRFVENAQRLLAAAGGPGNDFAAGRARAFVLVPSVEHITILFSPFSHREALDWLNAALDTGFGSGSYTDRRMAWYGLHLLGWLLGLIALSPLLPKSIAGEARQTRPPWHILGLVFAPVIGAGLLWLINQVVDVTQIGGIYVGGGFALWVFLWGLVWLLVGCRPRRFPLRDAWWGLLLFAVLWLAVGAMAQVTWLPWFLIPQRLVLWPLYAAAFFPWMWAAGLVQQGTPAGRRALWWLGQTVFLLIGMQVLALLIPGLSVLFLVRPLIPLLLGLLAIGGAIIDRPGAYALGSALFFGWLVLAYFPLS